MKKRDSSSGKTNRENTNSQLIVTSGRLNPGERHRISEALVPNRGPVSDADYRTALQLERSDYGSEPLSLYIHLPFCPSRCLSCDHHTTVTHDSREIDRYLDTMERELDLVADQVGDRRLLQQLHLGGGTPNYLSEIQLVRLVSMIERRFALTEATEASLDANAHRASHAQLSLLRGLGFTAINLEIRDLDAAVQQAVGRSQSLSVVRDVVESARDVGFERVTTDLVYGLPRQSASSIGNTLEQLLSLDPDRISCFAHSRRQDKFEHQRAVDTSELPSLADKVAMFSRIVDTLSDRAYQWIGLDCFARADDPISIAQNAGALHRNWIGYTPSEGRRVIGLGNSSVSDLSSITVRNHPSVGAWRSSIDEGRLPVFEGERLDEHQRAQRYALSDLMCNLQSTAIEPLFGNIQTPAMQSLVDEGMLELGNDKVAVTKHGRFTLHRLWGDASPGHRWDYLV